MAPALRERLRIGALWIDVMTLAGLLDELDRLVARRQGGAVYTPNVAHVVLAERDPALRAAYARADVSVADGMPLVWASHLLRPVLPAKLSGSDLVIPISRHAAERGWRLFLVGGTPGAGAEAARRLRALCDVDVVGVDESQIDLGDPDRDEPLLARIRASRSDVIFAALGAPKQEIWAHRVRGEVGGAVVIGVGASLDFIAGRLPRAPRWMSETGLEWLFRLASEPRRLWRRYLVDGRRFLPILLRTMRQPEQERRGTVRVS
jgi:N-acetylglucosaminyldiphosphoundecaprenol N-acetyl-beta-D-mannosaminyltransferase